MIVSKKPFEAIELGTNKKIMVIKEKQHFIAKTNKPVIITIRIKGIKKSEIFLPKEYEGEIIKLMDYEFWIEDGVSYKLNE